ncbi:DUF1450 domain-containing protein [Clostridium algidicarnis]|nr:DUF1450 domain-containing protein [Clostridium algidicarnis]MBU3209904.1 DUF1450 domain-containing protein [Clostridium algidicarnis]MBU3228442.1 DUF1450 domain-containing protein [Clostridium algidicarnis]MBU3252185.1 DUF1450 domain-containing protein [Clostridium algidicarnis]
MIKVCTFSRYFEDMSSALEKENIDFTSKECLLRCDLCRTVPFVMVDHEFIIGETLDDLISNIKEKLI